MNALMKHWKAALVVVAMAITGVSFTGCHTVGGFGRDIQAAGGGVEGTADAVRPYDRERR